ncbi:MAG: type II secretion system F family protein [Deltaproteobacteria bacterium]|nr:type II secretion system F family protein [Deltaproteobacteria bacterium]
MPLFSYRARDPAGMLITGELEANAEDALMSHLSNQGLIPLRVRKVVKGFRLPSLSRIFSRRIRSEELLVFTRQFQTLFKAGLGMDSIFSALLRQSRNKKMVEVLQGIRSAVASGSTLAQAFSKFPEVFRELYVNMLAAGEEAGILDETLKHLGDLLEKEIGIRSAVKSATLYPKIVIATLMLAITVLMIVVVPKFAAFYANYKAALPLPTVILMKMSYFFVHWWFLLLAAGLLFLFLYRRYKATLRGKMRLGELAFKLPVFGPLNLRVANARFCHILSSLYKSGLPITRALEITGGTIENGAFQRDVDQLRLEVTRGRSLSEGMQQCRFFTPVIEEAVAAGEKSGALDEMMDSVGSHYDMEVGHTIKNLSTLLEPILLFLIFGMVGLFALAIFLPIWNMTTFATGTH